MNRITAKEAIGKTIVDCIQENQQEIVIWFSDYSYIKLVGLYRDGGAISDTEDN